MVSSADTGYKVNPARLEPVDLAPYANRGFSDEFDNDGKGGWFDQGENDFRMMPTGAVEAAGVAPSASSTRRKTMINPASCWPGPIVRNSRFRSGESR